MSSVLRPSPYPAPGVPVWFDEKRSLWLIRFEVAPYPTPKQAKVVRALLPPIWPGRLCGDDLVTRSRVPDAVNCLKRLAQEDLWDSVIIVAGSPWKKHGLQHRGFGPTQETYALART